MADPAALEPTVRRAEPSDAAELQLLESRARAGIDGQRGAARLLDESPAIGDGWTDAIASPGWWIAVAVIDDVIVGYLAMEIPGRDRAAVVTQVWVEPDARGLGFGDALLAQAIDAARAAGATVIEATALPGDRETKNLYERAGVTARKIIVSKPL